MKQHLKVHIYTKIFIFVGIFPQIVIIHMPKFKTPKKCQDLLNHFGLIKSYLSD